MKWALLQPLELIYDALPSPEIYLRIGEVHGVPEGVLLAHNIAQPINTILETILQLPNNEIGSASTSL
jgi:hypothetical protein